MAGIHAEVAKLVVTASGGPFRGFTPTFSRAASSIDSSVMIAPAVSSVPSAVANATTSGMSIGL
jgi:hypothetical protein